MNVSVLVLLTGRMSFLSAKGRQSVALLAPVFLLGLSAITEGSPVFYAWYHGRSFPDTSDFVAGYIYLGFAFGYSIHLLGLHNVNCYRVGVASGFISGAFIVAELTALIFDLPRMFCGVEGDWLPVIVAVGGFVVGWTSYATFRWHRVCAMKAKP